MLYIEVLFVRNTRVCQPWCHGIKGQVKLPSTVAKPTVTNLLFEISWKFDQSEWNRNTTAAQNKAEADYLSTGVEPKTSVNEPDNHQGGETHPGGS